MTPSCLRGCSAPYAARDGLSGHDKFPHSVMGVGLKAGAPSDFTERAWTLTQVYNDWLRVPRTSLPTAEKLRRSFAQLYRSKGERYQIADYYKAEFAIDAAAPVPKAG